MELPAVLVAPCAVGSPEERYLGGVLLLLLLCVGPMMRFWGTYDVGD